MPSEMERGAPFPFARFGSRPLLGEMECHASGDSLQMPSGLAAPSVLASVGPQDRGFRTRPTPRIASATPGIVHNVNVLITASIVPSANGMRSGMTGIEAAIAIRNKLPKCNILLFSGQAATAELLEQARTQGHEFEILAKPVHPSDLLEKLRASSIFYS